MECFVKNRFQGLQLASINRRRSFLQTIHLSDIMIRDGRAISSSIYRGNKNGYTKSNMTVMIRETLVNQTGMNGEYLLILRFCQQDISHLFFYVLVTIPR